MTEMSIFVGVVKNHILYRLFYNIFHYEITRTD